MGKLRYEEVKVTETTRIGNSNVLVWCLSSTAWCDRGQKETTHTGLCCSVIVFALHLPPTHMHTRTHAPVPAHWGVSNSPHSNTFCDGNTIYRDPPSNQFSQGTEKEAEDSPGYMKEDAPPLEQPKPGFCFVF